MNANNLQNSTTFILGAGFSKCADLPIQSEFSSLLLSNEFNNGIEIVITKALKSFLKDIFGWEEGKKLPSLEDFFTCIDLSAATGHDLGIGYKPKRLRAIRRMAIFRIFSILDRRFNYSKEIEYLLDKFINDTNSFIVLNWDIVLEKHLNRHYNRKIDYCCPSYDWNNINHNIAINNNNRKIPICKMHGSSNWIYCENCKSLFYDLSGKLSLHTKAGLIVDDFKLFDSKMSNTKFASAMGIIPEPRECKFCQNIVSSHIATFSYRKSFRTHAYSSVWYHAEKFLSEADKWVFIGYSLPEADYEIKHLLKVAQMRMQHRRQRNILIDVIVKNDSLAINKFENFFGQNNVKCYNGGLEEYVSNY